MKCSICGTGNRDDVEFCRHCGVSIARHDAISAPPAASQATCRQCGRVHAIPARFCDQCGSKLPSQFDRSADLSGLPHIGTAASGRGEDVAPQGGTPPADAAARSDLALSAEPPGTARGMLPAARHPFRNGGLRQLAVRRLGLDTLDARQARRRLQLIAGLAAAIAGVILSGILMAQTLIVGAPPWHDPSHPAMPDRALMAAAERALASRQQQAPAAAPPAVAPADAAPVEGTGTEASDASTVSAESKDTDSGVGANGSGGSDGADSSGNGTFQPNASGGPFAPADSAPASKRAAVPPPVPVAAATPSAVQDRTPKSGPEDKEELASDENGPAPNASRRSPAGSGTQRRSAQLAASPAWYASMKAQLNRCADEPNLFNRIVCAEKTKFRYCSPNRWGQVAECIKTEHRDVTDLHNLGGWLDVEAMRMRQLG